MKRRTSQLTIALALGCAHCSSPSSSEPDASLSDASNDAGAPVDGGNGESGSAPDAPSCTLTSGVDGGACNTLTATQSITPTCAEAGAPAFTGGVIADGDYVLVSSTYYGDCSAAPNRTAITYRICGDQWQLAGDGTRSLSLNRTVSHTGATSLSFTDTCAFPVGVTSLPSAQYSVSGSTLSLGFGQPPAIFVDTFARQ